MAGDSASSKRRLDGEIVSSFLEARTEAPTSKSMTSLRNYLSYKNPRRWRRLQKDFEWAKSEVAKIPKANPEDVRFLL